MKTELTPELRTSLCDTKTIFSAHRFCAITRNLKYEAILNVKTGTALLFYPSTRHYTALLDTTYCLYGVSVSVTQTHTHTRRSYSFRGPVCHVGPSPHQEIKGVTPCADRGQIRYRMPCHSSSKVFVYFRRQTLWSVWCLSLHWHHRRSSSVPIKDTVHSVQRSSFTRPLEINSQLMMLNR